MFILILEPPFDGTLVAHVDDNGDARGHGAVRVREGRSHTTLAADGSAQAGCADTDGDGVAGLVRLAIGLRDVSTGETLTGIITPLDGDIDETGRVKVQFHFGRDQSDARVIDAWLLASVPEQRGQPGRLPSAIR